MQLLRHALIKEFEKGSDDFAFFFIFWNCSDRLVFVLVFPFYSRKFVLHWYRWQEPFCHNIEPHTVKCYFQTYDSWILHLKVTEHLNY
jgi:hypothetical protein